MNDAPQPRRSPRPPNFDDDQLTTLFNGYRRAINAAALRPSAAALRGHANRQTRIRRIHRVTAVAAAALALAATITALTIHPHTTTTIPLASPSASPQIDISPSRPTTASSDPSNSHPSQGSPAQSRTCVAADLMITLQNPTSSGPQEQTTLTFVNVSSGPCHLSGYPGLRLSTAGQPAMTTTVRRHGGPPQTVTLQPGGIASVLLTWNKYGQSGATCTPAPANLDVTPPGQTTAQTIPWLPTPAGSVCQGDISEDPIQTG